ncbi:MAG TPA: C69 family dipeptidase [Myxococcota bacterium]|jgi:dipeptidase|nr:C69 family dipeptidase [Myxococcota bacterium]
MCDSLVAVGSESASHGTVFAKNSDRKAGECQPFLQFPAAAHPPGAVVRCTHVTIPQVAETYRVMGHSPWWVFGFEHGVNEHGVAIGNETVFSREPVEGEPGLIGMDLVRLGLERGRSAREALEVIATLLETHGQGGPAFAPGAAGYHNGFLLADPDEAWILQTSGRRWAARRARLDAISNHLSLGADWEIGSRDLDAFARGAGWWAGTGRLDVAAAYRNPGVPGRISEGRLRRSLELLDGARGRIDAATMQRILRDHLDGGPVRLPGATIEEERFFTLCMHSEPVGTTTASLVAELPRDRERPWPVWISFATPCTGVFVPVYLDGVLPAAFARGGETATDESAWWAMKRLEDAAARDFPRHTPWLRAEWTPFEAWLESERTAAERRAWEARGSADPDGAARVLSEFMEGTAERLLDQAETLAARLAGGDASAAAR